MGEALNQKKPHLDDIAAELGLSTSTVSRAISGKGRISSQTRERVLNHIKLRNYRPNIIAKSLSESKTYNIGIVIPMDSDVTEAPFFQTCLMGVCRECAVREYDVVVINTEKSNFSQLVRIVENRKVDGIILTRPMADDSMEVFLKQNDVPFVVIGRSVMKDVITIDSSHEEGCRELTSYLLMSNPSDSIGILLGSMEYTVNRSRYKGFDNAFYQKGVLPSTNLVFKGISGDLQLKKAICSLIRERPNCIVCGDDMICMKLLAELKLQGLRVPNDIRVASFYDSVYLDGYTPAITSLIFNASELGIEAASALLNYLDGKEISRNIMLPFEMLIRKSTM